MDLPFDELPAATTPPVPGLQFDALPGGANVQPSVAAQAPPPSFDQLPESPANPPPAPPQNTTSPEKSNTEVPGFWSTVGSAFGRGAVQRTVDDVAGVRVALPAGVGGLSLEEQYQAGLVHPETKDELDGLLAKKVNEGWSDPKWWGAQVAHGTGSMVPGVAAAGVGALARIHPAASFGLEGGVGALVPAYKKARAEGLDPEAATTRAIIDSGISVATATAMGLAPSIALFGKSASVINEQVAQTLKRPVMEMLAQLGIVQPSLAVSGEVVKSLSHGETPDPWDLATTYTVGVGQGVPIVGTHGAMSAYRAMRSRVSFDTLPPATPEQIQSGFENQAPPVETPVRPEGPGAKVEERFVANEEPPAPIEQRIFYSPVRQAIEAKMPESAPAHEVLGILRGFPGVKQEEILDLGLPAYLSDPNGKVNKKDLIAHIESEAVQLEEVRGGFGPDAQRSPEYPNHGLYPGHVNPREFVLKIPKFRDPEATQPDTVVHWNEDKNVLGHFMTSDFRDRDGRNLLFIREMQSTAHQEGRTLGYREPNAISVREASARMQESNRELAELGNFVDKNSSEYKAWEARRAPITEAWKIANENFNKAPNLPFKTSWPELMVKRALRLAADEGYDGISWSNGDQLALRAPSQKAVQGNREFYDKIIPSLFKKWAKKLGMDMSTTRTMEDSYNPVEQVPKHLQANKELHYRSLGVHPTEFNRQNHVVMLNPSAGSRIRQGLPLYEQEPQTGRITLNQAVQKGTPKELAKFTNQIVQIFGQLGRDMQIGRPIRFEIGPRRTRWRGQADKVNGEYVIRINTRLLSRVTDLFATAGHELGHVLMWEHFAKAPERIKLLINNEFETFRNAMSVPNLTVGDMRRLRDNPVSEMTGGRNLLTAGRMSDTIPMSDLTPSSRAYVLHFEEWLAENVAKWVTTDEKPQSRVERFFKSLADDIRKLVERFTGERKTSPRATPAVQEWLDSLIKDNKGKFAADELDQLSLNTKRRNADALDRDGTPDVAATPQTSSTVGGRGIIDALPPNDRRTGEASAAHADRFNWFFKWMTSLPQVAELNRQIRPLQIYREIVTTMNVEKNAWMGAADDTRRAWQAIADPKQMEALNKFIEDYAHANFKLVQDGVVRRPTSTEFATLVQKHGLDSKSLNVFNRVVRDFDGFLEAYRKLLLADAYKVKDPNAQLDAVQSVNRRVDNLLNRPFFPIARFGKYTVTVYDSAENVRHVEHTNTLRRQRQILEALKKSSDLLPGDKVVPGEVAKDATPFLGMPPGVLDLLDSKLALSPTQRAALDQLRFDYAPSNSFKHQFRGRDLTPGYSTDFLRAYAHFFFHGANHITRVKWVDALRDMVRETRESTFDLTGRELDRNKRDAIANFMMEHMDMLVDPKPDFAALRGLMFHWYLGFNPASATLNLSQTPLMTYPFLASKFGDFKSVAALAKASTDLNSFYSKESLREFSDPNKRPPGREGALLKALAEATKEGTLSETQAHELAAISEDRNLMRAFGTKAEQGWWKFSEASSWMFEMTEQYNRRVAFRAAWDMAMREPNHKWVQETVRNNPLLFRRLIGEGWTHQEASAFLAAKEGVEKTQFVYAPYARPKLMQGRKGALFIFKSFVQNSLFNIASNPSMAWRHLLLLGAAGGLMGLPGSEDLFGLIKGLSYRLFGKDYDIEMEVRKAVTQMTDGTMADLLLHGSAVKGFGIPHVMNMLGNHVGLPNFAPTLDRSKSVSMGNILPFEPGKLLAPSKDIPQTELAQLQRASGAGFGLGFALFKFLDQVSQGKAGDAKAWEQIMPRVMSNISHATRYALQGMEKNSAGNAVVRFDVHDTEHMTEILARAMGYQPRRVTGAWEAISAKQEAATYWDLRKQILLRQFGEAVKTSDDAGKGNVLEAIKKYNSELPTEARGKAISAQTLKDSVYNRLRVKAQQEAGLPTSKQNYELFKSLDQYFPDGRPTGQVDARPVK